MHLKYAKENKREQLSLLGICWKDDGFNGKAAFNRNIQKSCGTHSPQRV
jgi:hypothetical protein